MSNQARLVSRPTSQLGLARQQDESFGPCTRIISSLSAEELVMWHGMFGDFPPECRNIEERSKAVAVVAQQNYGQEVRGEAV